MKIVIYIDGFPVTILAFTATLTGRGPHVLANKLIKHKSEKASLLQVIKLQTKNREAKIIVK